MDVHRMPNELKGAVETLNRNRNRAGKNGRRQQSMKAILFAASALLLFFLAGCGASLDRDAETIVVTDLSQVQSETFEGFDQLKVLDLRGVDADAALVDRLRAALPGCVVQWSVPIGGERFDSESAELTLPSGTTAADFTQLQYFPNLTRVDATKCGVDADFALAAAAQSGVEFIWNTTIYGVSAASSDTTLVMSGQTIADIAVFEALLAGLPRLERVDLTGTAVSADDVARLNSRYPDIRFDFDVDVFGERISSAAESLDLSNAKNIDLASLESVLPMLPALTSVDLSGHPVGYDEMDALSSAFPNIQFLFAFEVFSQPVTNQTTRLELNGYPLSSPEELAAALKYLPNLEYADLCGCGLTNEQMETLMVQFPKVRFVWTITIGAWEIRSDITAFSKGNRKTFPNGMGRFLEDANTNLYNEDIVPLKYCKDLVFLDLGHGNRISDLTPLANLTKLRALIISMNKVEDLSPLSQLKELECLEIYQNPIQDLSVITELPKLKYLNCSSTLIDDVSVLLGMQNLEMLWFIHNRYVSAEQRQQLKDALPDCEICFSASSSGEGGWTSNGLYIEYQTAFGLPYNQ